MKTTLCDCFITTNALALTKAILESLLEFCQELKEQLRKTTRSFLPAVQLVTSLNV